jgi:hypothetical protein
MLRRSFSRFLRRKNSAKLGRPVLGNPHDGSQHQVIHFGPPKRTVPSVESQSDSLAKSAEEHHNIFNNRHQRTSSTSISRTNREHQSLMVLMTKNNEGAHVLLPTIPDLLREKRRNRRSLWSNKPQITL